MRPRILLAAVLLVLLPGLALAPGAAARPESSKAKLSKALSPDGLPRRLVQAQHAHHDLNVSTLHLHLDHDTCLEAVVLRGPTAAVTDFARGVITQRGVRHGHLWMVPVSLEMKRHSHDAGEAPAPPHVHSRPTT